MTFSDIYRTNRWGGRESLSGPGSGTAATARVAEALKTLVAELGVTSVLDVGCGDGFWVPDLPGYVGVDVAPEAIERARVNHPTRVFEVCDARRDVLPRAELVIVRDAIQHLPLVDGRALLHNVVVSGATWLLASTFPGGPNVDIAEGEVYTPDLQAYPFTLGLAEMVIADGYAYEGEGIRDPRKLLGLWGLG